MTAIVKKLEPAGMLDGVTANELKSQVLDLIKKEVDIVLLDMKGVNFMNSSGIGTLVATLKVVRQNEKQLYLCGLSDQVKMIFKLTKMDRVFKPFEDLADFETKVLSA
jgi:anti-sigma B factor antagonist